MGPVNHWKNCYDNLFVTLCREDWAMFQQGKNSVASSSIFGINIRSRWIHGNTSTSAPFSLHEHHFYRTIAQAQFSLFSKQMFITVCEHCDHQYFYHQAFNQPMLSWIPIFNVWIIFLSSSLNDRFNFVFLNPFTLVSHMKTRFESSSWPNCGWLEYRWPLTSLYIYQVSRSFYNNEFEY